MASPPTTARPRLLVLLGPPAVGKMAVGRELEMLSGLPLFHNHMSIDLALRFFPWGTAAFSGLVAGLRHTVLTTVARGPGPGVIFTYVLDMACRHDGASLDALARPFLDLGARVDYVELAASQAERLRRNETPLRLAEKAPMRNTAASRARLLALDAAHVMTSSARHPFPRPERHLFLDTTTLSAPSAAAWIHARLGLPHAPAPGGAPPPPLPRPVVPTDADAVLDPRVPVAPV